MSAGVADDKNADGYPRAEHHPAGPDCPVPACISNEEARPFYGSWTRVLRPRRGAITDSYWKSPFLSVSPVMGFPPFRLYLFLLEAARGNYHNV